MNKMSEWLDKGTVMVEFAIVLPLLLLVLFGITELGRALYQQNMLTKYTIAGSRFMVRGYNALDEETCEQGDTWDDLTDIARNIVMYGQETETSTTLLPNMAVEIAYSDSPVEAGEGDSFMSACVITVVSKADFKSIFGEWLILPIFNSGVALPSELLNARVEERYLGE